MNKKKLQSILNKSVKLAKENSTGKPATYIPELANAPIEKTGAAISLSNGEILSAGDCDDFNFSLQSTAKVVSLIGLLEEFGAEQVFKWINAEPTSKDFNAIAYSDRFTHRPSNPMINAGAIALCSHIPGENRLAQLAWLDKWMFRLFNKELVINNRVYTSELDNSDRNRSLAYLMRSEKVISGDVDRIIKLYTALCSYETNIVQASYLPMLLANRGKSPDGEQVISEETVKITVSILATCGLYNETGYYLMHTGMPAKSGVSGLILAVGLGYGGLAVFSPRLTPKGGSVRGQIMLEYLANQLGWHFAIQHN